MRLFLMLGSIIGLGVVLSGNTGSTRLAPYQAWGWSKGELALFVLAMFLVIAALAIRAMRTLAAEEYRRNYTKRQLEQAAQREREQGQRPPTIVSKAPPAMAIRQIKSLTDRNQSHLN